MVEPKLETRDSDAIACAQYYERGRERGVGEKREKEKERERGKNKTG